MEGYTAMGRVNRDGLIDKKIGAVVRLRRVKLGMSQSELGRALGVSFQQIQKYEQGANSIASTRIADLCRTLEITPNELFGVSGRMDDQFSQLSTWGIKTALKLQELLPAGQQAVAALRPASGNRGARGDNRSGRRKATGEPHACSCSKRK